MSEFMEDGTLETERGHNVQGACLDISGVPKMVSEVRMGNPTLITMDLPPPDSDRPLKFGWSTAFRTIRVRKVIVVGILEYCRSMYYYCGGQPNYQGSYSTQRAPE